MQTRLPAHPTQPNPVGAAARRIRPCLTPRLRSALRGSVRWAYPPGEGATPIPTLGTDWQPPPLDPSGLAEAGAAIAALERHLEPADPLWLSQRIAALLAHAWVPDLEGGALAMVVADWQDALERFPGWAVAEAVRRLIGATGQGGRRCTIAAAVAACAAQIADAQAELDGLKRLVDPREQERARARRAEAEAEEGRAAERVAFVAANPGWSPLKDALRRVLAQAEEAQDGGQ